MATREQLIEDFADHKYATGEKFARLINSMKVVQEPVETPAASGTSLSFIDSISQDADGKITATKKTLDLSNAHELNPFKGWWKTGDTLPTSGFDGAYLYFKDTTQSPAVTTIYRWNGTAYADTGTVVDESNVQTFGSGQAVNGVKIKNESGEEVQGPAGVLSAEAGTKLSQEVGYKTTLGQLEFVGKGTDFASASYPCKLIEGHTYRFYPQSRTYDRPYNGTSNQTFAISLRKADNTLIGYIALVYDNKPIGEYYTRTISNSDASNTAFIQFGGRANDGVRVVVQVEDITKLAAINSEISQLSITAKKTEVLNPWSNIFTKDKFPYQKQLTNSGEESENGGKFKYIMYVGDHVRLNAYITSNYQIQTAIHDTFSGAKADSTNDRHIFGRGKSYADGYTQFRFGDSDVNSGYLVVSIERRDKAALSAEDIESIQNDLVLSCYPINSYGELLDTNYKIKLLHGETLSMNDFEMFASDSDGNCTIQGYSVRVKFFRRGIEAGWKISVNIDDAKNNVSGLVYSMGVWSDIASALGNNTVGRLGYLLAQWTDTNTKDIVIPYSGILNVYFKKSDNSAFTMEEAALIKNGTVITVEKVEEFNEEENEDYESVPMNTFEVVSSTVVQSASTFSVPYLGVTYRVSLPNGLKVRCIYGPGYSLYSSSSYVEDGGTITIPNNNMFHRFQFAKVDGSALSIDDITNAIINGDIKVTYLRNSPSVMDRNSESQKYAKAAMWTYHPTNGYNAKNMAVFAHISDLHGDSKRFENFIEFAKAIGVDGAISTGDNVLYTGLDGSKFMADVLAKHSGIPYVSVIGNHEVSKTGDDGHSANMADRYFNNTRIFSDFIQPYANAGGYLQTEGTAASLPYYYIDFTEKLIRIIVLNQFDSGSYGGQGKAGRIGGTQLNWLYNTLKSTPANFGIIIAMHSPETTINTPQELSDWNQTVNYDGGSEDDSGYAHDGLYDDSSRPIRTMVDALISRASTTIAYEWTDLYSHETESVSVNVDFTSNVNEGVEFICYLTGHRHKDNVGYVNGSTNPQLILNVCCGNCYIPLSSSLSFSEGEDIPRDDNGVVQDAFNILAVDRANGRVKVARVGSSLNFEGIKRTFLLAPYKDINVN